MRSELPAKLEKGRVVTGEMRSEPSWGPTGMFHVQGPCGEILRIVASAGDIPEASAWEHVSVSTRRRIPNWLEMSFVKDLFWCDDECVVQYHPPKSEYVNNHAYVLHLWRNTEIDFPMPPAIFVGIKEEGLVSEERARELRAQARGNQEIG
jgi:hypothetical protein